jgi:transcriptional regulator with XRE-family HTH domain
MFQREAAVNTMTASAKEIGQRLREARISRGWTQRELADRADTYQSNVSHWESGRYDIYAWALVRLAIPLGVSTDWLLGLSHASVNKSATEKTTG